VVYGRTVGDTILEFEASGALMSASLVMRDRQTDSWWSIMTSDAIGGPLEGTDLRELPVGEKTTWGKWRRRHPETLVLSVDGAEHVDSNPYDRYFGSDETFRNLRVADDRLPAKAPIYSFWLEGKPWAAPHEAFAGGRAFAVADESKRLLLYRRPKAAIYESSEAWLVDAEVAAQAPPRRLAERLREGQVAGEPIAGFDTFWYTWVAVQQDTGLMR
jgi:hypothetical protein